MMIVFWLKILQRWQQSRRRQAPLDPACSLMKRRNSGKDGQTG